jgi:hypothetical protein
VIEMMKQVTTSDADGCHERSMQSCVWHAGFITEGLRPDFRRNKLIHDDQPGRRDNVHQQQQSLLQAIKERMGTVGVVKL